MLARSTQRSRPAVRSVSRPRVHQVPAALRNSQRATPARARGYATITYRGGRLGFFRRDQWRCEATTNGGRRVTASEEGIEWFIWGSCEEGQLGLGQQTQKVLSPIPHTALNTIKPKTIALGMNHFAIITKDNEVHTWGQNREGQLGTGDLKFRAEPTRISIKTPKKAVGVFAGHSTTFIVAKDEATGEKELWASGVIHDDKAAAPVIAESPVPLEFIPQELQNRIKKIYAGSNYHFCFTDKKEVYGFGLNEWGQLGQGPKYHKTPVLIDFSKLLKPEEVLVNIKSGQGHVLALSSEGQVFAWGHNNYGQCGIGSTAAVPQPVRLNLPGGVTAKRIAAGSTHSIVVDSNGGLMSFGSYKDGKLGIVDAKVDVLIPTYVQALADKKVELTGLGLDHNAIVTQTNELYTWGFGQHAALGHGDVNDRAEPTLVKAFGNGQIVDVEAGQDLTVVAIATPQDINV